MRPPVVSPMNGAKPFRFDFGRSTHQNSLGSLLSGSNPSSAQLHEQDIGALGGHWDSPTECRDRRRLYPSMRIVPGTDCAALRYETKSPRPAPGALAHTTGSSLPADLEAGSATGAAVRAAAKDVTAGDKLDPKRTVAFVVRGGAGLAKCIQAALLRTRGCGGESRQLEDHPRAAYPVPSR